MFDLGEYFLIGYSIEGRTASQQNEENDAAAPYVTFLIVVLSEDFWGDVVRRAVLLFHPLIFVEGLRGPEINHHDRVDCSGLVEQQIFRFQIAMDDVALVAVVNRREDLAHYISSVALCEALTGVYFIEEFSSGAESE